jgi:hypothetical protein
MTALTVALSEVRQLFVEQAEEFLTACRDHSDLDLLDRLWQKEGPLEGDDEAGVHARITLPQRQIRTPIIDIMSTTGRRCSRWSNRQ